MKNKKHARGSEQTASGEPSSARDEIWSLVRQWQAANQDRIKGFMAAPERAKLLLWVVAEAGAERSRERLYKVIEGYRELVQEYKQDERRRRHPGLGEWMRQREQELERERAAIMEARRKRAVSKLVARIQHDEATRRRELAAFTPIPSWVPQPSLEEATRARAWRICSGWSRPSRPRAMPDR